MPSDYIDLLWSLVILKRVQFNEPLYKHRVLKTDVEFVLVTDSFTFSCIKNMRDSKLNLRVGEINKIFIRMVYKMQT